MIISIDQLVDRHTADVYGLTISIDKVRDDEDKAIVNILSRSMRDNREDAGIIGACKFLNPKTFRYSMSLYFKTALSMSIYASYVSSLLSRHGAVVTVAKQIEIAASAEQIKHNVYSYKSIIDLDKCLEKGCISYRMWLDGDIMATSDDPEDAVGLAFMAHECQVTAK